MAKDHRQAWKRNPEKILADSTLGHEKDNEVKLFDSSFKKDKKHNIPELISECYANFNNPLLD
jgi:hypothetical protein